ncbi:MAG: VWA domain-containing protein [Oleispira sp.]|nr:VWA domain-containing protein [Oleispira sp.]
MMDWFIFDFSQLANFHLLRPLWLLAMIPLAWTIYHLWYARSPFAKWQTVISPILIKAMRVRHGSARIINPLNVFMGSAILVVIILSGPSWKQQASPFSEDLSALVIVLDASTSMEQKDVQPSRLERAKQKIEDLLLLRPGGRVGLIVYAGSAHSVIPLTNDIEVVRNFLKSITSKMMPKAGKFAEKALPIADKMLSGNSTAGLEIKGTVALFTDGIGPDTNAAFKGYFSQNQHQLLILGIGQDSSHQTQIDAGMIPLETAALKALADNSGGYYQALSLDKADVKYLNRRVNSHLVIVDDGTRPWLDAGYYLIYPLIFLMLFWFRKGWTLNWTLIVMLAVLYSPASEVMAQDSITNNGMAKKEQDSVMASLEDHFLRLWLTPDQLGQYYMWLGNYAAAARSFDNIPWRAIALYRGENFIGAAEMFSRIDSIEGHFNLANAWAHSRNYIKAVKSYNDVLKLDKKNKQEPNSIYNRALKSSALKNRDKIQQIIDEINLLSASQQAESSDSSRDLTDDQPQTADGAERSDFNQREVEPLTAEDILLDESVSDLWMRQVQKDPSQFLSIKFHMQLEQ